MILGLYHPARGVGHDTGVALVDREGRIVAALSEERLSRVKMDGGFPFRALDMLQRMTGITWRDLDAVAVPFMAGADQFAEGMRLLGASLADPGLLIGQWETRRGRDRFQSGMQALGAYGYLDDFRRRSAAVREQDGRPAVSDWREFLRVTGLSEAPLVQMDHHLAHAAAAYWMSGIDDALVITIDGVGALKSGIVAVGTGTGLRVVARTFYPHSAGEFWELITTLCGFHHMKHGGKITGLAAHGDPDARCYDVMRRAMWAEGLTIRTRLDPVGMQRALAGVSREDIAATAQRRLTEVVVALVKSAVARTGRRRLAVAGGVFANVRMNQAIAQLPEVESLFVCPVMGDEGLGVGAALHAAGARYGAKPAAVRTLYLGPEYPESEMVAAMAAYGLTGTHMEEGPLAQAVADRIADGKVVAIARGRLELGPRALGHRTILYRTSDPAVNQWLNQRLNRTEFMPFAPVTLDAYADQCYVGLEKARASADYMTVTFDCTPAMRAQSPAVVHLDGTARPQLVRPETDAFYHAVLEAYHARTGVPSLVNTSFNMHEEPIVASPDDAARAFVQGHLDTLVLGPYLIDAHSA
ncbi:MAG: carbamoyltransferase C-terminal domain-containing protein [Vicinamibacterales bacterium]